MNVSVSADRGAVKFMGLEEEATVPDLVFVLAKGGEEYTIVWPFWIVPEAEGMAAYRGLTDTPFTGAVETVITPAFCAAAARKIELLLAPLPSSKDTFI